MNIVISSVGSPKVRGVSAILDEVDESRKVVDTVADILLKRGAGVVTFHDDISLTKQQNREAIVQFHNDQARDLDVQVAFNHYTDTDQPMGTEVLYVKIGRAHV